MWRKARHSSGVFDIHSRVWTALSCWPSGASRYRVPCWKVHSVVSSSVTSTHFESLAERPTYRQRREDHTLGPIHHRRSLRSNRFRRVIIWSDRLPRSCAPWLGSVADLGTFLLQQHAMAIHQHHREKSGEVSFASSNLEMMC